MQWMRVFREILKHLLDIFRQHRHIQNVKNDQSHIAVGKTISSRYFPLRTIFKTPIHMEYS